MKQRVYWTEEELASLHALYESRRSGLIPLAEWAGSHGRDKPNVARKARELGLTEPNRPKKSPRVPRVPKHATDEARRAAIGNAMREYIAKHGHPRGALGMHHTDEAKRRVSEASRLAWASVTTEQLEARRLKRVRTNLERYGNASGSFGNTDQPYSRVKGGKRPDLDNRYFRSAWEANYARYLNFLVAHGNITGWEYEADTFVFPGITRGAITYTPDFKITAQDGSVVYHEVKGWMTPRARMALSRMAKFYPDVQVHVVDEPQYRELKRQFKGLIETWE